MKIIDGVVIDPRRKGIAEMPFLSLLWEQEPIETAPIQNFSIDSTGFESSIFDVRTFGSFFEVVPASDKPSSFELGKLNTSGRFPEPLLPVIVSTPEAEAPRLMFVPLSRGRRLVRKWNNGYQVNVNEFAARRGELLWSIVEVLPTCKGEDPRSGLGTCFQVPKHVVENETNVTWELCDRHHQSWTQRAASRRAAARA